MSYTPGVLKVEHHATDGTPSKGRRVRCIPSVPRIRDVAGRVLLSGVLEGRLDEAGRCEFSVPPSTGGGIDPGGVTYTVAIDAPGIDPVRGISVVGGEVVHVADVTSVVPAPVVPNVLAELEELRDEGQSSADVAEAAAVAAAAAREAAIQARTSAQVARTDALAAQAAAEAAQADVAARSSQVVTDAGAATGAATIATTKAGEAGAARDQAVAAALVGAAVVEAPTSITPGMLGSSRIWTLSGSYTLGALPIPAAGTAGLVTLTIKQAAAGGPFAFTWPAGLKWASDAPAPVMPTVANAELVVQLLWTGAAWRGVVTGVFFP